MTGRIVLMAVPDEVAEDAPDAEGLACALVELVDAWNAAPEHFDVETMRAVGAVIAEARAVIDFGDGR